MKKKILFKLGLSIIIIPCLLLSMEAILILVNSFKKTNKNDRITYTNQFLHPYYFFFFGQKKEQLAQININQKTPWIGQRGYGGGLGPEHRGKRKLAFLLGGSTAFGDGASDHSFSIASYLNRMQKKYFFVNAAVPSWNTFQELLRLLREIIPARPKLVISLTSWNDIVSSYRRIKSDIPPDAPESFEDLSRWVKDIRSDKINCFQCFESDSFVRVFLLNNLLEKIGLRKHRVQNDLIQPDNTTPYDKRWRDRAVETTAGILQNLEIMDKVCKAHGIEFMVLLQPYKKIHPVFFHNPDALTFFYRDVVQNILAEKKKYIFDLSIPFKELDRAALDSFYFSDCHFNDEGYKKLAEIINSKL